MDELNYEQDINIDEYALDVEWLDQPNLMRKYTKHEAQLKKQLSLLKEELNILKAELDYKIRSSPDSYGLEKITNDAINSVIVKKKEYQQKVKKILEAEYELNMCKGAILSLNDKRSALENLVKLMGMQYFAGPSDPRDISFERQQQIKRKKSNSAIKIGKKKRTRNG